MNPLQLFKEWYAEENAMSNLKLPAACCLSTIGVDGYPNARFVSLKELINDSFVITGPIQSRKGIEIESKATAALTFWWTFTERQIRIQGDVIPISNDLADQFFDQRGGDSKIVSSIFNQGEEIQSFDHLRSRFEQGKEDLKNINVPRPEKWSGYFIQPIRIEFMQFKSSRLHERRLFECQNGIWNMKIIQP